MREPPKRCTLLRYLFYDSQQINLHFEKFHCDQKATFCNTSGCLHQTYVLSRGHYTLVKSFYGPDND